MSFFLWCAVSLPHILAFLCCKCNTALRLCFYLNARGHTLSYALRAALRAVALSHARLRAGAPRALPCRLGACCPAAGTDTFDFFAGEASPAKEACHKIFRSVAQNKATNNHFFSISESVSFLLSLCYTERRMVMKSAKYSYWLSVSDLRRCGSCKNLQGKIFTKASSNPLSDSFSL